MQLVAEVFASKRFGGVIDHLSRDPRVLNFGVSVGKATPLLFLLLGSRDYFLCGLKQIFKMFGHGSPPVRSKDNTMINEWESYGLLLILGSVQFGTAASVRSSP
jgi:hypothetical protein